MHEIGGGLVVSIYQMMTQRLKIIGQQLFYHSDQPFLFF